MRQRGFRTKLTLLITTMVLASLAAVATPAAAAPRTATRGSLHGTTAVTTAPGIATAMLSKGVVPLPLPKTGFSLNFAGGLTVTYSFPITGGNPSLSPVGGDIFHAGGIYFVSLRNRLAISDFDIDLAAGKVFATKVNFARQRVPILDLNLAGLKISTKGGATVLSGIRLYLDPVAANVLNSTFHLGLPADGSVLFGSAKVTLRT
jgi:hypothetical protein